MVGGGVLGRGGGGGWAVGCRSMGQVALFGGTLVHGLQPCLATVVPAAAGMPSLLPCPHFFPSLLCHRLCLSPSPHSRAPWIVGCCRDVSYLSNGRCLLYDGVACYNTTTSASDPKLCGSGVCRGGNCCSPTVGTECTTCDDNGACVWGTVLFWRLVGRQRSYAGLKCKPGCFVRRAVCVCVCVVFGVWCGVWCVVCVLGSPLRS